MIKKIKQLETLKVLMFPKVEIAQNLDILPEASKEFSIDAIEDVKEEEIVLVANHLLMQLMQPYVYSKKWIANWVKSNVHTSAEDTITLDFKNDGDLIYLLGTSKNDIASSEYLYSYRGIKVTTSPTVDLQEEKAVQNVVARLIINKAIQSVHNISVGGLFIALAESAMIRDLGFSIKTNSAFRKDAFLFGEAQNRVLVSIAIEQYDAFDDIIAETEVKASFIGKVKKGNFVIDAETIITTTEAKDLLEKTLSAYIT